MSKYQIEDKVKDFFDQREIKPSNEAWDKINAGLDIKAEDDIKVFFNERELKPTKDAWAQIESALPITRSKGHVVFMNSFKFSAAAVFIALFFTSLIAIYLKGDFEDAYVADVKIAIEETEESNVLSEKNPTADIHQDGQFTESNRVVTEQYMTTELDVKANLSQQKRNEIAVVKIDASRKELVSKIADGAIEIKEMEIDIPESSVVAVSSVKDDSKLIVKVQTEQENVALIESLVTASNKDTRPIGSKNSNRKYGLDPAKLLQDAESKSNDEFLTKVFKGIQETSTAIYTAVSQRNIVADEK